MALDPLDWLFSLAQFGIKFGLDNIRGILAELGHPERQFRSVHVAGTNGKGSVTAIVDTALRLGGLRTGRYTSPHLIDLSERFVIDGVPATRSELCDAVATVRAAVERLQQRGTLEVHPTFFEVTTATAFELFRRRAVEIAVCEVGLGGRLDATNVLSPIACAITSIALDHQQYLGHTLREIATEKAGIIKPGTPVVVGPVNAEVASTIAMCASTCGAPVIWATLGAVTGARVAQPDGSQQFALRTPDRDYGQVRLALAGDHQVANALVAVRLLEQLERVGVTVGTQAIVGALDAVQWPGRLQQLPGPDGRYALLDAAHNAEGAQVLARHLSTLGPARPLVFAAMRDKDAAAMLSALTPVVSHLVVTRASNPRSVEPEVLAAVARRIAPALPVEVADSPREALERAWSHGAQLVVAGSIFLLGDVMKELGRS